MARSVDMRLLGGTVRDSHAIDTDWLARNLRFNFYLNRLASGDRLPSVRELGKALHISPNTALELYKGLENAGLVETRPRSGTFLRRVGHEADRSARDLTVFALMVRVTRRLELMGVSPADFSDLLLRYCGLLQAPSFSFAFISSVERFELLEQQISSQLKWRLPVSVLPPDIRILREQLSKKPTIRCLLSSYIYCDLAFALATEFDLHVIVERLCSATAVTIEPPATGRRYIVTRDSDFAEGIRQMIKVGYGGEFANRLVVGALDESERMLEIDAASEVMVSPLALDGVAARYGSTKRIVPLRMELSRETLEDLLFHYAFLPKAERAEYPGAFAGDEPHTATGCRNRKSDRVSVMSPRACPRN